MSYAQDLNCAITGNEKVVFSNNESIQDEYNYEYYMHSDQDQPFRILLNDNNDQHSIIISDQDEDFRGYSNRVQYACDGLISSDLNRLAKKHFILLINLTTEIPSELALRSDVLLI